MRHGSYLLAIAATGLALGCTGQVEGSISRQDDGDDRPEQGGAVAGHSGSGGGAGARAVGGGSGGQTSAPPVAGAGGSLSPSDAGVRQAGAGGGSEAGGQGGSRRDAGGVSVDPPPTAADAAAPPQGLRPAIIAAGYGAIRLVSFDEGKTWVNRVVNDERGGDDDNLIRAINYVDGRWVAVGWKIFLSEDGKKWREKSVSAVPGSWYDCVTFSGGKIVVKMIRSGQGGAAVESSDHGETWKTATGPTTCTRPNVPGVAGEWQGKIRFNGQLVWDEESCCNIESFARGMAVP